MEQLIKFLMKKIMLSIGMIGLLTNAKSQTAPLFSQFGLDVWESGSGYSNPVAWHTLNPLKRFGFEESTIQSSDAHSGGFAALLETKANPFQNLPGLLCSGPLLNASMESDMSNTKVPFVARPVAFGFYCKSLPMPNDACVAAMVLTKWNSVTQQADTIATADFETSDTTDIYTMVKINFQYQSTEKPDSAFIIFSSSKEGFDPLPGSKFWIDDVFIEYSAGIIDRILQNTITMYPNPAQDKVTLQWEETIESVEVISITGEKHAVDVHPSNHEISVAHLPAGVYFISIQANKNLYYQKFIKL